MSETEAVHLLARGIVVASQMLVPILIASLVVGVVVSLVQAATQVQEMTLSFAPKLGVTVVVLLMMGPWMIGQLVDFTRELFQMLPQLVQ
jgi:flagellar biosynthetic protein FliQ